MLGSGVGRLGGRGAVVQGGGGPGVEGAVGAGLVGHAQLLLEVDLQHGGAVAGDLGGKNIFFVPLVKNVTISVRNTIL